MNDIDLDRPIVIDFETFYAKDYTLKAGKHQHTTEQYIRSNRFECIGCSVKFAEEPTRFFPNTGGIGYLENLFEQYPNSPVVSHNTPFDLGILGLRYNLHPKYTIDTMVLAKLSGFDRVAGGNNLAILSKQLERMGLIALPKGTTVHDMIGVHAKDMTEQQWRDYAEYCKLDTDIAYAIYKLLVHRVPLSELIMADITTKMFTTGVIDVDTSILEPYVVSLENEQEAMLGEVALHLGYDCTATLKKAISSRTEFPKLLGQYVDVPTKISPTTGRETWATAKTDKAFADLLEHENPIVRTLVATKLNVSSSIEYTRSKRFLDIATRGLMPIPLRYASAHTGRYGGSGKINLQNLSKRTKDPILRRSMRAKAGHVWVASDSSQIELRLNAYISGQTDLVQVFKDKRCPYVDMATEIYKLPYDVIYDMSKGANPTKEGKAMRNVGKEVSLACGYGMGAETFGVRMELAGNTDMVAKKHELVNAFRRKNYMIPRFWGLCGQVIEAMAGGHAMAFGGENNDLFYADGSSEFFGVKIPSIRLPNGAYLFYQNLRPTRGEKGVQYVYDKFENGKFTPQRIWGSLLTENLCQALAFVILKWQAINIYNRGVPIHINVHDEWGSVVPRHLVTHACVVHYQEMSRVPDYLPQGLLACEVDVGWNYADLKTIDVGDFL